MSRTVLAAGVVLVLGTGVAGAADGRRISRAALEDKIRGGWAGQVIGVTYGAPTEFHSNGKINEGKIDWTPAQVEGALDQDDLYVEMTFAEVMDRVGLEATTEQYGEMFRDSQYRLWHANAGARRNLARGIKAPWSGHPKYNVHANDIDFQIESDFIGLMTPGLPREANKYADRVGRVMNYGDGLYGGMLFGGMYAAAFFETDPHRVVEEGLRSIPEDSGYAKVIRDVIAWHAQNPTDWRKTWRLLEEKWDRDDPCPEGALVPFNIDAKLNGAYVVLGLLYGDGDMGKTIEIATRAGQDSDCNPSSAAGILGVMLGYSKIPDVWKSGIPAMAGKKFAYTQLSFDGIVASTIARALKVVAGAGGTVGDAEIVVPRQTPKAPPLEQWDPGVPTARVEVEAAAWTWTGGWRDATKKNDWSQWKTRDAAGPGDAATLTFEGTGVAIVGMMSQEGGRADVWVDGKKAEEIDAWIPERTFDSDYFHVTGLENGRHTVRLVVRPDADRRSTGKTVAIERAIVYGPSPKK
ncbi:MAG: ADP-ribosylglycohydrolase family protein [Vicinamibacteria bacterium]